MYCHDFAFYLEPQNCLCNLVWMYDAERVSDTRCRFQMCSTVKVVAADKTPPVELPVAWACFRHVWLAPYFVLYPRLNSVRAKNRVKRCNGEQHQVIKRFDSYATCCQCSDQIARNYLSMLRSHRWLDRQTMLKKRASRRKRLDIGLEEEGKKLLTCWGRMPLLLFFVAMVQSSFWESPNGSWDQFHPIFGRSSQAHVC